MKVRCSACGKSKEQEEIRITSRMKPICKECWKIFEDMHFNTFELIDGNIVEHEPYEGLEDLAQRGLAIDYIHGIFNGDVSKSVYAMLGRYLKTMSYLDIVRALEYHFVVKKGSVAKAKKSIGIVPYVIEDARRYYKVKNDFLKNRFKEQILVEKHEEEVIAIKEKKTVKKDKIDLSKL